MQIKDYLFLSPHTDDAELCCGGTIYKLTSRGNSVTVLSFSDCSIPGIADELNAAHEVLKVNASRLMDYKVRHFDQRRQDILESLVDWAVRFPPDAVFIPDPEQDIHQDHQIIGTEAVRAFKNVCDIYGFSHPHNSLCSNDNYFSVLSKNDAMAKLAALEKFKSQAGRIYFAPDVVLGTMWYYGAQCGAQFAESFRVIRAKLV